MAVFCEKFGWSFEQYMHSTNFMTIDLMLIDSPRMVSKKDMVKEKKETKGNIENTLLKFFG